MIFLASASPVLAKLETKEASKTEPAGPALSIPIPTIQFSTAKISYEGSVSSMNLPWIAQYISGAYKYLVALGGVVAAVMLMVGGFLYITAADTNRVTRGKQFIVDAVSGLALIIGAWLILTTVNPDLSSFSALKVEQVQPIIFSEEELMASTTETTAPEDIGSSSTAAGGGGGGGGGAGTPLGPPPSGTMFVSQFSTCPFELSGAISKTEPSLNARTIEFMEKIIPLLSGTTWTQKIVQIAEAAARCQVFFGSCGRTVGSINMLAEDPNHVCFKCIKAPGCPPRGSAEFKKWGKGCWFFGRNERNLIGSARSKLCTFRCHAPTACGEQSGCYNVCADPPIDGQACTTSMSAAAERAYKWLEPTLGADYPDKWTNALRPGDSLVVYNGNGAGSLGTHSMIFLGWKNANGLAVVAQGGVSGYTNISERYCFKRACRPKYPITKIFYNNGSPSFR